MDNSPIFHVLTHYHPTKVHDNDTCENFSRCYQTKIKAFSSTNLIKELQNGYLFNGFLYNLDAATLMLVIKLFL